MSEAFNFLYTNRNGILVLFLILFAFAILVHYIMWMLGIGRFSGNVVRTEKPFNIVMADALFKIINDFRHLLALLLLLVFGGALTYALYIGNETANGATPITNLKEALQAVMATLGGLVGSIIGYYFGESSRLSGGNNQTNPVNPANPANPANQPVQKAPDNAAKDQTITEAPKPKT